MQVIALFALYLSLLAAHVSSAPVNHEPLHRLALRKIPMKRDDEHPIMAFQRHQTEAIKRLHRFTGRDLPDPKIFTERLRVRRRMVENDRLRERMWFPPAPEDGPLAGSLLAVEDTLPPHKAATNKGATAIQPAAAAAATTIDASGSNQNGFSNAALAALTGGTLTNSTSDLVQGGEAYFIEANDIGYLVEIEMGTPAQTFLLLADTGSGDTWVPSTSCTQCGRHTAIGPDTSTTFQTSMQPFSVTYGSGAVAGTLCSDTMTIAGMKLANQGFGVALQESVQFSGNNIPFDGLMGLSFSTLSQQGGPTPIDALQASGQIKEAILGIALGRVADGENDGELVFGAADTSKLDAATTQTLAVSSTTGFWQVAMAASTVNGVTTATNRQAILDTGTSLIVAPAADATAVHAQIAGSASAGGGMFTIPCTTTANIALTFGGAAFQIDARDLIFQPAGNDPGGECISAISAGTVVDDVTWLLGDTFLKNVYMTTNVQTRQVTLSARTDSPGSSSFGQLGTSVPPAETSSDIATPGNQTQALNAKMGGVVRSSSVSLIGAFLGVVTLLFATVNGL